MVFDPWKKKLWLLIFGILTTWLISGFMFIKIPLSSFLKYIYDAPLYDYAKMVFIMGRTIEGKVIGKDEDLF